MSIRPAPLCPPSWRACSGGQHRPLLSSDINRRLRDSSPHTPPLLALRAARELFPKPSRLRITAGTQMQPTGPGSPWSARARGQSWQPPAPPATISELSKHAGWPAVYCTPHGGLCRRLQPTAPPPQAGGVAPIGLVCAAARATDSIPPPAPIPRSLGPAAATAAAAACAIRAAGMRCGAEQPRPARLGSGPNAGRNGGSPGGRMRRNVGAVRWGGAVAVAVVRVGRNKIPPGKRSW